MSTADALTPDPNATDTVAAAAAAQAVAADTAPSSATDAPPVAAEAPVAAAPTVPAVKRPSRLAGWGMRFVRIALGVALLAAGAYYGYQAYLSSRPVPVGPVGDPAISGVPAPAVVQELAAAIDADDADRIRTALNPQVFDSYASELQKYDLLSIERVETLGTYVDGPRAASMLVLHAQRSDTSPFTLFLVVITENGQIVRLR